MANLDYSPSGCCGSSFFNMLLLDQWITRRIFAKYQDHRAKWATFFILMVDDDGKEILIDPKGEKILYPYKSAADEFGA